MVLIKSDSVHADWLEDGAVQMDISNNTGVMTAAVVVEVLCLNIYCFKAPSPLSENMFW